MTWLEEHAIQIIALIIFAALAVICGIAINNYLNPAQTVTTMPQQTAETVAGTKQAAEAAHITIDTGQAKEAAQQIKEIRTTEQVPVYIVQSTGATVQADTETARKKAGADYAIVTAGNSSEKLNSSSSGSTNNSSSQNADNLTSEAVDLSKIKDSDKVVLNQYNVQAYKKQLNTISYAPQEKVIGYEHAWKIDKAGHYVGVGIEHDIDDKRTYLKLTYTW